MVRDKYSCGQTVSDTADAEFLYDLLLMHPSAAQKVGSGVASFQVERNDRNTIGFWLTRTDGSRTDFSFLVCLTPPNHEQKVRSALRNEVQDQIDMFKFSVFGTRVALVPCAITGELVTWNTCHVDHEPSFDSLVKSWMSVEELTWDLLRVRPSEDGETEARLLDLLVIESWTTYHRQHARLQITTIAANQSKPRT